MGGPGIKWDSATERSSVYVNYNKMHEFTFSINSPHLSLPNAKYPGLLSAPDSGDLLSKREWKPIVLGEQLGLVSEMMKIGVSDGDDTLLQNVGPFIGTRDDSVFSHFEYYSNAVMGINDIVVNHVKEIQPLDQNDQKNEDDCVGHLQLCQK